MALLRLLRLNRASPEDRRLWFLDYDIVQVTAGVLEPWFEGVVARAREIMGKRTLMPGRFTSRTPPRAQS